MECDGVLGGISCDFALLKILVVAVDVELRKLRLWADDESDWI